MKVARIRGTDTYVEVVNEGPNRALVSYVTNTGMHMEKIAHWVDLEDLIFDPVEPTSSIADAKPPQHFCMIPPRVDPDVVERKKVIARLQLMIDELEGLHK